MVNREEARRLISAWLTATSAKANLALELIEEQTVETEFGWLFFNTSKQFKETGDFRYALAGNRPMIRRPCNWISARYRNSPTRQ